MAESTQEIIKAFWKTSLVPEKPATKVTAILPPDALGQKAPPRSLQGSATAENVTRSFEAAKKECIAKVAKIVQECRRVNAKYIDPYFDLDDYDPYTCIAPLSVPETSNFADADVSPPTGTFDLMRDDGRAGRIELYANDTTSQSGDYSPEPTVPPSAKRVTDIFDNPRFFVDGASSQDIKQGNDGDCWFLSALSALCSLENGEQLLERICPAEARDAEVGVYGFLLFRDGEWTSVIIDDKLYLSQPSYDSGDAQVKNMWNNTVPRYDAQEEYRRAFQSNSRALYYAQSTHPDETWVPLIEKAYAKAHGDYGSIEAGWVSDGVEDLTGGVSMSINPTDILSKDKFWTEGLLLVNKDFLFGIGTGFFETDGLQGGHAYSVLRAVNYGKERLVMIKNPWSHTEWNGPWSDGSKEWTSQAIRDLNYTFGDDGVFWMRYSDMLRRYRVIFRTRLFGHEWNVTDQWTQVSVPWAGETRDPRFYITVSSDAPTVIALSQLDDRYFRGLVGQYQFRLSFRLYKEGEDDYFMRTLGERWGYRSTNVEVDLEAGRYEVRLHISARRTSSVKVEEVIKANWLGRTDKLLRVGASYDYAHAKGRPVDEETPDEPSTSEKKEADDARTATSAPVTNGTEATPTTQPAKADSATNNTVDAPSKLSEPQQVDPAPSTSNAAAIPPEANVGASSAIPDAGNPNEAADAGASPVTVIGDDDAQPAAGTGEAELAPSTPTAEVPAEASVAEVDPWGAICVVGLRVYCKNASATVEVAKSKASPKPVLDVDNPSKDIANSTA